MKILAIIAHPNSSSTCHKILAHSIEQFVGKGHIVENLDLYLNQFNPLLNSSWISSEKKDCLLENDVKEHGAKLKWAQALFFIYPLFWGDRPAILKGWFDRVFHWGSVIEMRGHGYHGLLQDKRAIILQTSNQSLQEAQTNQSDLLAHEMITTGTLCICGIQIDAIMTLYSISNIETRLDKDLISSINSCINKWV